MELADELLAWLEKQPKPFVTKSDFLKSARWRKGLGVGEQATLAELETALSRHCGDRVRLYRKGTTGYVGLPLSGERMILDKVARQPRLSPRQVAVGLPLNQETFRTHVNQLLERGELLCVGVNSSFLPLLAPATAPVARAPAPAPPSPAAFHAAYLAIGKGQGAVRIHRLREHLGWERQVFDTLLLKLMADEQIILQRGDPTSLTTAEVRNSFEDINGMLYVTLSWIGRKP